MRRAASSPCLCPQSLRETKPPLREWALEARSLLVGRLRPGWEGEGHAPPPRPPRQGQPRGDLFLIPYPNHRSRRSVLPAPHLDKQRGGVVVPAPPAQTAGGVDRTVPPGPPPSRTPVTGGFLQGGGIWKWLAGWKHVPKCTYTRCLLALCLLGL